MELPGRHMLSQESVKKVPQPLFEALAMVGKLSYNATVPQIIIGKAQSGKSRRTFGNDACEAEQSVWRRGSLRVGDAATQNGLFAVFVIGRVGQGSAYP